MILSLHLTNFTIISELNLEFQAGMTAFTGETGAGKSIIIDAIQLALGARLEHKVVREGHDKSIITLIFDIKDNVAAQAWLKKHDCFTGNECILRRTINQDGRNRAFINDQPATLQALNQLGEFLLNIHGQNQHQSLIIKESQLAMLDTYGKQEKLLNEIKFIANAWQQNKKQLSLLLKNAENALQKKEFLKFQLAEFENLDLQENEVETLDIEFKRLSNAENLLKQTYEACNYLSDSEFSIQTQLHQCIATLASVTKLDNHLKNSFELLNNASVFIDEAYGSIKNFQDNIELNPERLNEIDERLAAIHNLARKHRVHAKDLKSIELQLSQELNSLDQTDEQILCLEQKLQALEKDYHKKAQILSQNRQKAAKRLSQLISQDMQTLNMKGGKFEISLNIIPEFIPNELGQERVEFLVTTNIGQALQPLAKIASGGELSRISLAIQVNTAKQMQTPALIFDEIDTGIGGATADIVGHLLQRLGEETQVLCITHLPQVASKAHHHLKVEKFVQRKQTFTSIKALSEIEKIEEIARMLGGSKITKESIEHAKALLES